MDEDLEGRLGSLLSDPANRAKMKADNDSREALCKAAVDRIAEKLLGIRPEHGDPIYTQHPVMAGVIRRALAEAFNAGGEECAKSFVRTMLEVNAEKRGR